MASSKGVDLTAALEFARTQGQGGLRTMSYAERGKLIGAVADVLIANRVRYEDIAIATGNTKIDAAIDIDGGIGTSSITPGSAPGSAARACAR